ncbi:hypothetical protein B0H14DRAFT_2611296 [Mycena olivaceomarginata]|nr:hypothetical protein B0H14DRAFT_2611296 [Mycena olivaceomarginata]
MSTCRRGNMATITRFAHVASGHVRTHATTVDTHSPSKFWSTVAYAAITHFARAACGHVRTHVTTVYTHAPSQFRSTVAYAGYSQQILSGIRQSMCIGSPVPVLMLPVHREDTEAELRTSAATTLLVGRLLRAIESNDKGGGATFYRVFGSPRVSTSRDAAVDELVQSQATGLLVGKSLALVEE